MAASLKRKPGRPPGRKAPHRPVLSTSARVDAELYEAVLKSALNRGRTVSEEVAERVKQSFEWERQFVDVRKLIDDTNHVTTGTLLKFMESKGWRAVRTSGGKFWVEPESAAAEAIKKLVDGMMKKGGEP